jgi:branched-chain amino acid transport system permease protein
MIAAVDIFLQQLINGLTLGSIYALVALGYTMVYGILGLINFAHGEVVMIGALSSLTVIRLLADSGLPGPVVVLIGQLAAALACMALGFTIERVAYRPLRNAPRLAPLITAIGVSIVLQQLAMLTWGRSYHSVPALLPSATHEFMGASFTEVQVIIVAVAALTMTGLRSEERRVGKECRRLCRSRWSPYH